MEFKLSLLVILLFSNLSLSAETCIQTSEEYELQKEYFPPQFRTLPIYLTMTSWKGTAALKIHKVSNNTKLKLDSWVWKIIGQGSLNPDIYIKQICFDKKAFEIVFENDKKETVTVVDEKVVLLQNETFKLSSEEKFLELKKKVRGNPQPVKPAY